MNIKITVEKIIKHGKKGVIIKSYKCLPLDKLPLEYKRSDWCLYKEGNGFISTIRVNSPIIETILIRKGDFYTEKYFFKEILPGIKKAGKVLKEIKEKIKKENDRKGYIIFKF